MKNKIRIFRRKSLPIVAERQRTVTVFSKIKELKVEEFSVTDLKHLNGVLYYRFFQKDYPNKTLEKTSVLHDGKNVPQFLFPAYYSKEMTTKINFHFYKKGKHNN